MYYKRESIDEMIERNHQKRHMPLLEFIMSERLNVYELGHEDIVYANELQFAIVPCDEYMIFVRERLNEKDELIAEYAIYSEHDHDGRNLRNSLNANAEYYLEYVDHKQFENMAQAIVMATGDIYTNYVPNKTIK